MGPKMMSKLPHLDLLLLDRGHIGVEGVLGAVNGDGPEDANKAKGKRREPGTAFGCKQPNQYATDIDNRKTLAHSM